MDHLIIFDFNRTLYDPDTKRLIPGVRALLEFARAKRYTLVLLSKASPSRSQLVSDLGIAPFFAETLFVEHKSAELFEAILSRHHANKATSFVIGDRAQSELAFGHQAGLQTIWLKAGKFAAELPPAGHEPAHIVTTLNQITPLL